MDNGNLKSLVIIRYRRKSTEGDERQIASLADQASALNDIERHLNITETQILDDVEESKSAKLPGRFGFNKQVIDPIEQGKANAIICWHADRLSRNAMDTAVLVNLMDTGKLHAVITNQQIFWNKPMDKFMLALMCGQAKLENDNKGINVKRGLNGKIRKGWRPGVAPIGYLNNKTKEKGERDIVIDQEKFPQVRKLFDFFLTGNYSVRKLREVVNTDFGIRTRKTRKEGGKPLSISHVYHILGDPFYYGSYSWRNAETGCYDLHKGNHTPMITEEEYRTVQAILGHTERPQPKKRMFAYTGLIRCGECRSFVTAEEKWQLICGVCKRKFASEYRECCPFCDTSIEKMPHKKVLHYVYYHCTKKRMAHCSQRAVRLESLEAQIDDKLRRVAIKEKYMYWALDVLKEQMKEDRTIWKQAGTSIGREESKLKEQLTELNWFIIKQENDGWTLMKKEDALQQRDQLEADIKDSEEKRKEQGKKVEQCLIASTDLFDYAQHARFWLQEGTVEQKRNVTKALGSNLTLKDRRFNADLEYPLPEIAHMLEIAPEMSQEFEPTK